MLFLADEQMLKLCFRMFCKVTFLGRELGEILQKKQNGNLIMRDTYTMGKASWPKKGKLNILCFYVPPGLCRIF